jgi:hypothetical protein
MAGHEKGLEEGRMIDDWHMGGVWDGVWEGVSWLLIGMGMPLRPWYSYMRHYFL